MIRKLLTVAIAISLSACGTTVVQPGIQPALPIQAMKGCPPIPEFKDGSLKEFEAWAGEEIKLHAACILDNKELIDFIKRNYK